MKKIIILSTLVLVVGLMFLIRGFYVVSNITSTFPALIAYTLSQDIHSAKKCILEYGEKDSNATVTITDSVINNSVANYYFEVKLSDSQVAFQVLLINDRIESQLRVGNFVDYIKQESYNPDNQDLNSEKIFLFETSILSQVDCLEIVGY